MRRYGRTQVRDFGRSYGTSYLIPALRSAIERGSIRYKRIILQEAQRLDAIAGKYYGDGTLGWVIGAASNIGWMLQVPPGTVIIIPNLEDIQGIVA